MRKLATIRRIDELNPIEGADAIECAVVGGWKVVAQKGLYAVGDLAVYFEIDSWIPHELAPFLSKGKEPREFEGVKGERLKTIRLRGQLSQGLLMPIPTGEHFDDGRLAFEVAMGNVKEGDDVTEILGIKKWEKAIPAQLAGVCRGNFPTRIPKTDQERVQNLVKEIVSAAEADQRFEVTEKLEGSSMTCYLIDGEFGVCSRNLDLKETAENAFWKTARETNVEEKMRTVGDNFAIQGELIGPGIQNNIYKLTSPAFFVFDIYDIKEGKYLTPAQRLALVSEMGLKGVPILHLMCPVGTGSIEELLKFAEGKSTLNVNQEREGIVFKDMDGGMTFKVISNKYLLGETA